MDTSTANDPEAMWEQILVLQSAAGKIAKLIDSQWEAMQRNDLETLDAILNQKQLFIDQILGFRVLQENYQHALSSNHLRHQQLADAYQKLEESIRDLAQADQAIINQLKERHADIAHRLQLITRDRQATDCYSQSFQQHPKRRIDISG